MMILDRLDERVARILTIIILVMTIMVCVCYGIIFVNPGVLFNPFPPTPVGPLIQEVAEVVTETPATEVKGTPTFPPTWTPTSTPTSTETPTPTKTATPTFTLTPTPTDTPTFTPTFTPRPPRPMPTPTTPPTWTSTPRPAFPWSVETVWGYPNCGTTGVMGITKDRWTGELVSDVAIHYWADGMDPGYWANTNDEFMDDLENKNWDGVLDSHAKAGRWHAVVVRNWGDKEQLSPIVDFETTGSPCEGSTGPLPCEQTSVERITCRAQGAVQWVQIVFVQEYEAE